MDRQFSFDKAVKQILFIIGLLTFSVLNGQSSVLSSGSWYKIGITESGIYKIDQATLNALGITSSIDPRKISVFGNGVSGPLPQPNERSRPVDLLENAIYVSGETDGVFNQNDFILFYGVGPDHQEWTSDGFSFEKNPYSDTAYYFLRVEGADGKRISPSPSVDVPSDIIATSFDDHLTFEEDINNLITSGRTWVGELLSNGNSQNYSNQIDGLVSDINLTMQVIGQSSADGSFDIAADQTSIGSIAIPAIPSGPGSTYSIKARSNQQTFTIPERSSFTIGVTYNGGSGNARGFIDRFFMTFSRELKLYGNETDFRVIGNSGQVIEYRVKGASTANIWNVTDPTDVKSQLYTPISDEAVFKSQSANLEEFVAFSGSDFPSPFVYGVVPNQNLRSDFSYDGLIITSPAFEAEARRLAEFHNEHDALDIKVATLSQVYNEFSSGRQDITAIRDYAKYIYDQGGRLKYLLLFGDCSYDYKDRVNPNTNFVPTYESRESFHPIYSHSSDDYFGFFEEEEGEWMENFNGDHTLEIGIGRLPVKTAEEAKIVVDKIIYYATSTNSLGKWRNNITYLADDGDFNIHAQQVENLSELVDTTYAQYAINKLLLDAFEQESGASKDTSPKTTSALKTTIKNGTFSINFIGHGNERQWTEEEVLTRSFISELTNKNKLPIFVTATCEFGRYDDPRETSGAEALLLSSTGGAIALLTTSRPVFASTNYSLNKAFHDNMYRKVDGKNQRLGDIIRFTKNQGLEGPVNRNFTLLGDPMMMPAFPKLNVVLDEVSMDTLSALEEVTFSGKIMDGDNLRGDFNGSLVISVLDKKQQFKTKGQESAPYVYTLRNNALFRGEVLVEDGQFNFSFIVPKNISYEYSRGKMSFYAWDEELNIDAAGSSREFVIGGTNEAPALDDSPPTISMFLNDRNFESGNTVGSSSLLIAEISDESGITTARTGVVDGITLELNGESINLNEFYTASPEGYQRGTLTYPIQDLLAGKYTATLKVWDTHNNMRSETIEFNVTDEQILFVYNHAVYPNPIQKETTFYFEHDREDEDLSVTILVYSPRGEIIKQQVSLIENSSRFIELPWEAVTQGGQRLYPGVYYYRLIIQSKFDGATKEITQKLVINN